MVGPMTQDRAAKLLEPFKFFCMKKLPPGENSACQCEEEIVAALVAAREEGRRAGLEEAAQLAFTGLYIDRNGAEWSSLAAAIRALADKGPT